jgi:hypothetical protein
MQAATQLCDEDPITKTLLMERSDYFTDGKLSDSSINKRGI